jgi:hypothetical protein
MLNPLARRSAMLAIAVLCAGCGDLIDIDTENVVIAGTVRAAATGQQVGGAVVSLERALFVFQGSVAADTTDQNGRYRIEAEVACTRNTDLYESPGNAHLLVAKQAGYQNQSNINIGIALRCINSEQTVNFSLAVQPAAPVIRTR